MSRLTYPVITKRISREQVLNWHHGDHVWANAGANRSTHTHTQSEASNHTKRMRVQEERNGCFPNHMRLPSMPVRPVWKHEWAACKSIGTRDLVSRKSSADWHVLHVISLHCAARRKIILLWLASKRLLCCSSCLSEEREHMPLCKRCWLPLLLCQRLDYVQHHPPHTHTHTRLRLSNKGLSLSLPFCFQKSSDLWQWILEKFCASFDAC